MLARVCALATVVLVAAACNGDEAAITASTAPGATATSAADATAGTAPATSEPPGAGETSGSDVASRCGDLVEAAELEGMFAEPVIFDEPLSEILPGIGALSCVWSSVEDEADLEDLQVLLFQVQVYDGPEFYSADFYEDVETLPGIGDEAFLSLDLGDVTVSFRDGDTVVIATYSVIGSGDAPEAATKRDQVVELVRVIDDRT